MVIWRKNLAKSFPKDELFLPLSFNCNFGKEKKQEKKGKGTSITIDDYHLK